MKKPKLTEAERKERRRARHRRYYLNNKDKFKENQRIATLKEKPLEELIYVSHI